MTTTFTIDTENNITAHANGESVSVDAEARFSTEHELAALAGAWPGARLIEIWNSLPGVQPVRKFTSRKIAVHRIWSAIQNLDGSGVAPRARTGGKTGGKTRKQPEPRAGSKTEQVLKMLKEPSGATLKALMDATKWQAHYADARIMPTCVGNPACGAGSLRWSRHNQ